MLNRCQRLCWDVDCVLDVLIGIVPVDDWPVESLGWPAIEIDLELNGTWTEVFISFTPLNISLSSAKSEFENGAFTIALPTEWVMKSSFSEFETSFDGICPEFDDVSASNQDDCGVESTGRQDEDVEESVSVDDDQVVDPEVELVKSETGWPVRGPFMLIV